MSKPNAGDVILGAAAGVIATVPMTITMEQLHRLVPEERHGPLPPREVTEGIYDQLEVKDEASEEQLEKSTLALHYAFGGSAGALFPLVAPRTLGASTTAGVLYGLTVWSASYLGLLPALGVRHHARHDSAARTAIMIAAHVVWGAALGALLRARPGSRTAARDPESS